MTDDAQLLRAYSEQRSEHAFTELVRRHVNLVYGVALKQLGGNSHRAEDVTQQVFCDLARKARPLSARKSMVGWLYVSTHHAAAQLMRTEQRRDLREKKAQAMNEIPATPEIDWSRIRPLLEQSLLGFKEDDRNVILLRFFEGRPFAEIGQILGLQEDAARRRTDRALERLRAALSGRGITSTATALAAALGNEAALAAPPALAGTVANVVFTTTPAAVSASLGATALHIMSTTKVLACASAAALLAVVASLAHHEIVSRQLAELLAAANQHYAAASRLYQQTRSQAIRPAASPTPRPVTAAGPAQGKAYYGSPEFRAAWRAADYGLYNHEFQRFFAERHLSAEQVAQFDTAMDPDPKEQITFDANGRWTAGPVNNSSHQRADLQAVLGADGFQALEDYEKSKDDYDLSASVAAMALDAGSPLTADQVSALGAIIGHNDHGRSNQMAGTPHAFDWDAVVAQAQGTLDPGQMAALKAMQLETVYRVESAAQMYPGFQINPPAP